MHVWANVGCGLGASFCITSATLCVVSDVGFSFQIEGPGLLRFSGVNVCEQTYVHAPQHEVQTHNKCVCSECSVAPLLTIFHRQADDIATTTFLYARRTPGLTRIMVIDVGNTQSEKEHEYDSGDAKVLCLHGACAHVGGGRACVCRCMSACMHVCVQVGVECG